MATFKDFFLNDTPTSGDFLVGYSQDGSAEFRTTIEQLANAIRISGINGVDGKSAYELWQLASPANVGDLNGFLNSLIGVDGKDGIDGQDGADGQDGLDGRDGIDGQDGINGKSAYELWQLVSPANTGDLAEFLNTLKGDKGDKGDHGDQGDSAYNLWLLEDGNDGKTVTEFLNSLKGEKGDTGSIPNITTSDVTEGSRLYFTSERASGAAPVQSVNDKIGNVAIGIDDIPNLSDALNSKQPTGNYVELENNYIPSRYIPGSVDQIEEFSSFSELQLNIGSSNVLYVTTDNNKVYRWGGTVYVEIVASPGTTTEILEGNNLYFTSERARLAAPVQSVANRTGDISLMVSDITGLSDSLISSNVTSSEIVAKLPLGVNVGIYKNDSIIPKDTPFETILQNMLITRVAYSYKAPTLSVDYQGLNPAATYEVGDTISFNINPTYTKNDGGNLIDFTYSRAGSSLGTGSSYSVSAYKIVSNTTFQVSANYSDGPIYNDNLGNPDNNNIKAGTLTATKTVNVLYPYFYGKSTTQPTVDSIAATIQAGNATKVIADANGTVSITYNANAEYIWFAHLASQTTKKKWYNTVNNNGDIGSGTVLQAPATKYINSPSSNWTNIEYKIYIGAFATKTEGVFELRNS